MSREQLDYALRITLLPLIQDVLATGMPLPEIRYISEQAAQRAAARGNQAEENDRQGNCLPTE